MTSIIPTPVDTSINPNDREYNNQLLAGQLQFPLDSNELRAITVNDCWAGEAVQSSPDNSRQYEAARA